MTQHINYISGARAHSGLEHASMRIQRGNFTSLSSIHCELSLLWKQESLMKTNAQLCKCFQCNNALK